VGASSLNIEARSFLRDGPTGGADGCVAALGHDVFLSLGADGGGAGVSSLSASLKPLCGGIGSTSGGLCIHLGRPSEGGVAEPFEASSYAFCICSLPCFQKALARLNRLDPISVAWARILSAFKAPGPVDESAAGVWVRLREVDARKSSASLGWDRRGGWSSSLSTALAASKESNASWTFTPESVAARAVRAC
jgi:hypothetical protein